MKTKKTHKKLCLIASPKFYLKAFLIFVIPLAQAQTDFPFDDVSPGSGNFSATINIDMSQGTSAFKNGLLGSNIDGNAGSATPHSANLQGFDAPRIQAHLNSYDPVVVRFPQGVFANVYHWRDERINGRLFIADSRVASDPGPRNNFSGPERLRLGYPSLRGIFRRARDRNRPLDMLTVLNIVNDSRFSSGDRVDKMRDDGFTIRDLELGNEFFFLSQRTNTISTEAEWVVRARETVQTLRFRGRRAGVTNMRFAVPVSWRSFDAAHVRYNNAVTADESFFDAIVVHRYVQNAQSIPRTELNGFHFREVMRARIAMNESIDFCTSFVSQSKRKVWLTEWGVGAGSDRNNGGSFLGMADTYMSLIQRPNVIDRANWFSAYGANAQYRFNSDGVARPLGFGRVYETFRNALRSKRLYNRVVVTAPILTHNETPQGIRAISAVAIQDGNNTDLLVTNLTNKTARILLRTNGVRRRGISYTNRGIRYDNLRTGTTATVNTPRNDRDVIEVNPYSVIRVDNITYTGSAKSFNGDVDASKTSLNVYPNPNSTGVFTLSNPGNWEVYNIQGAKVKVGEGEVVNLSGFSSGLYLLRMDNNTLKLSIN